MIVEAREDSAFLLTISWPSSEKLQSLPAPGLRLVILSRSTSGRQSGNAGHVRNMKSLPGDMQ